MPNFARSPSLILIFLMMFLLSLYSGLTFPEFLFICLFIYFGVLRIRCLEQATLAFDLGFALLFAARVIRFDLMHQVLEVGQPAKEKEGRERCKKRKGEVNVIGFV